MIERALKLRHAIDLFFLHYKHQGDGYDISKDLLTPQDWVDLDHFIGVLKPFKDLTKRMEGRADKAGLEGSHGSLYETLESLDVVFKKLQEAGTFADEHPGVVSIYYSHAIDAARVKLEEYFGLTDATPAYRCAVALHPANKFAYFELEWSHNKQWISEAKRVVREVFSEYEAAAAEVDSVTSAERQEEELEDGVACEAITETLDPLEEARERRRRLAAAATSGTRGRKRAKLTSELDEFMARTNKADLEVENPLDWWIRHATDYPSYAVAAQYPNFEVAPNGSGCPVPEPSANGSVPAPVAAECSLGRMPYYLVNVTDADEVAKSVQFASKYNLRFRVKNTGHCFTGRSLGQGTFAVWTHHMTEVESINNFVPAGTSQEPQNVLAAGPGLGVAALYAAGAQFGGQVVGGLSPVVGATGRWVLGDGVGPFGSRFGMGVDNIVQFDVVTADGSQKIANEVTNSDLFWALRGGGGAFAVTTKVYIKLHPAMKAINTVGGGVVCDNRDAYFDLQDNLVDLQVPLSNAEYSVSNTDKIMWTLRDGPSY
ncbi:hypothetical protein ACQRIU_006972 [Beauveria bassiana]